MMAQQPGVNRDVKYARLVLVSVVDPGNGYDGRFDPTRTYTVKRDHNTIVTNEIPLCVAYLGSAGITIPDGNHSSGTGTVSVNVIVDIVGAVWLPLDTNELIITAYC